jgi:hypothetical protein
MFFHAERPHKEGRRRVYNAWQYYRTTTASGISNTQMPLYHNNNIRTFTHKIWSWSRICQCKRPRSLLPLACQYYEFECRRAHGCLSLVSVVFCQVSLWRADRSSRGVLQSVVCLSVIVKPPEGPSPRGAVARRTYINTATKFMSTAHFTFDPINAYQIFTILHHSPPHLIYNRPTDTASAITRNSAALMAD